MANTMSQRSTASQRDSLADLRPQMAKADLDPQVSASDLPELVSEAIRRSHGKQLAAAAALELSESHLGRLIGDEDLKLKHLRMLGPRTLAAVGQLLLEQYGDLVDPATFALSEIERAEDALKVLRQFVVERKSA